MIYRRPARNFGKMTPGSLGGQSRVASPVNSRPLGAINRFPSGTFGGESRVATQVGCPHAVSQKVSPSGALGEYYIEADVPQLYPAANVGNLQGVKWNAATEVGGNEGFILDNQIASLMFIRALTNLHIDSYASGPPSDTGYVYIYWDVSVPLGTVRLDLISYTSSIIETDRLTVYNTTADGGDDMSCFIQIPRPMEFLRNGYAFLGLTSTNVGITLSFGGELWVRWAE